MCGHNGSLKQAIVEGSMLSLCNRCLQYGSVIEIKQPSQEEISQRLTFRAKRSFGKQQQDEIIVSNFGNLVKRAREKMGKTQEEVAQDIAEKSSVLAKVESGSLEPPVKLAKKLEQFYKVSLIKKSEKVSREIVKEFNVKDGEVTIGDLIKFKK